MMLMRSTLTLAACLAMATAFAPSSTTPSRSALSSSSGSIDFRGKEFKFDPLNFGETYGPLQPFLKEAEIRHGRTAMLAVVGFIVPEFVRIPGDLYSFESIPRVIDAHDYLMDKGPMGQLLLWIGLFELVVMGPACTAAMKGEREPGDFQFGASYMGTDPAKIQLMKDKEILNGRLAMFAAGGIATQSVITGHGFPYI